MAPIFGRLAEGDVRYNKIDVPEGDISGEGKGKQLVVEWLEGGVQGSCSI